MHHHSTVRPAQHRGAVQHPVAHRSAGRLLDSASIHRLVLTPALFAMTERNHRVELFGSFPDLPTASQRQQNVRVAASLRAECGGYSLPFPALRSTRYPIFVAAKIDSSRSALLRAGANAVRTFALCCGARLDSGLIRCVYVFASVCSMALQSRQNHPRLPQSESSRTTPKRHQPGLRTMCASRSRPQRSLRHPSPQKGKGKRSGPLWNAPSLQQATGVAMEASLTPVSCPRASQRR